MECKTCIHASFERTPTGRIKRDHAGRCELSSELSKLAEACAAPCVAVITRSIAIWPDTCATNCSRWKPTTHPTKDAK